MKNLILLFLLLPFHKGVGQSLEDQATAEKLVLEFLVAFHEQDTLALREMVHEEVILQSIAIDEDHEPRLRTEHYGNFLKALASIAEDAAFEEVIHGMEVRVYQDMAQVSTPYSFYLNNQLSHCGVNNFQLMKDQGEWRIIYLVDTRRTTGCSPN